MTYILFKYVGGKKVYLSVTGKWIKSTGTAACYGRDPAIERAKALGCCYRVYSFR